MISYKNLKNFMDITTEKQNEAFETCNTKNEELAVIAFVLSQRLDMLEEIAEGIRHSDCEKCFELIRQKLFE
ncbi:MAG: hypothetical protein JEY97_05650 [Bacteroidales bacterium]|nr:hypothetical protein [Bacteroidales bacterium]